MLTKRLKATVSLMRSVSPPTSRIEERTDPSLFRLGIHAKATSNLDLLAVGTASRLDYQSRLTLRNPPKIDLDESRRTPCPLIFRLFTSSTSGTLRPERAGHGCGATAPPLPGAKDIKADQTTLYVYTTLAPASNTELTLGVSYDQADTKISYTYSRDTRR